MTASHRRASLVCLSLVVLVACGKPHIVSSPQPPQALGFPDTRLSEHVIVVSIDGLRPDAIATFKAPTLQRLIEEGAYTLTASTILPSKTLPSHTSMLTGEPPERHGVLWNTAMEDAPGQIDIPTVFGEARGRGYSTAAFFSKSKFSHLQQPGTLDYSQAPGGWFGRWTSTRTIDDVAERIREAKWNLLFVHLPDPDVAGHAHGWMSEEYGRAVIKADGAVARLMQLAAASFGEDRFTLIVTADHGGHNFDHGSDDPRDVTIPWISWGRGVHKGELPTNSVRTMDTAATALYLLGVTQPTAWAGLPIRGAYNGVATAQ